MTLKYAKRLAYLIQALLGLHTGLYINVYVATFGQTGALFIDLDPKLIGITWIGLLFLIEYPLELFGGSVADRFGSKSTFIGSFILRAFFSIGTAIFIIYFPPTGLLSFLLIVVLLSISFAVAFTLLSGNFEIWLRSLCDSHRESNVAFTWSETFFWMSLILGGTLSLLLSKEISLIISAACAFVAAITCLLVKDHHEPNSVKNKKLNLFKESKIFWKLAKEAKPLLQKQLPDVNRVFWVLAIIYGLAQTMEGFIPAYYVLSKGPKTESLIIVMGCLWLPSLIGAAYKTPLFKSFLSYFSFLKPATSENITSIDQLRSITLKYALVSALIPITLLIPSTHIRFIALGLSIFFARILYGALRPLFKSYAASRIHEIATTLPDDIKQKLGKKTMMSIGEQRMKLGAIISILPFYLAESLWNNVQILQTTSENTWSYFAALGITAIALAFTSSILLRDSK